MELTKHARGSVLEIVVKGRLDAYWSDHLTAGIEESVRQGAHHIRLNLAQVDYISSAGIRVLLKFFKQLSSIQGSLGIVSPSQGAYDVLELAGLSSLVVEADSVPEPAARAETTKRLDKAYGTFEIFETMPEATLTCQLLGNPAKLEAGGYQAQDSHSLAFPQSTFGLGLGAFGTDFADCRQRFGEFLALEGAAVYLPTDGTNIPDYVVSEGLLVPELEVLYGIQGKGSFGRLLRFEARAESTGQISLTQIIETTMEVAGADTVAVAMVAESAGLVGAALKRSVGILPTGDVSPLSFPAVRDWLSFTAERGYHRTLCVIVGVASRVRTESLDTLLRPLWRDSAVSGHFHAAVFPYRPLQRGDLSLEATITDLFSTESVLGMLHLLSDDREIEGVGQSEFFRGACWFGPITQITKVK